MQRCAERIIRKKVKEYAREVKGPYIFENGGDDNGSEDEDDDDSGEKPEETDLAAAEKSCRTHLYSETLGKIWPPYGSEDENGELCAPF